MQNKPRKVVIITTGGTIDKTYDENEGTLDNRETFIRQQLINHLRLPYTELEIFSVLSKDSLHMNDDDREFLAMSVRYQLSKYCPILVIHGTDTMAQSAQYCYDRLPSPQVPVIFTGAMKPLEVVNSDAQQNVVEALMACHLANPGFYISFHNRLFTVPNVRKNRELRTFESK